MIHNKIELHIIKQKLQQLQGVEEVIDLDDLNVDIYYQRTEKTTWVNRKTKEFNLAYVGRPVIARRPDGTLYILDGQQRILAAKKSGQKYLLCVVHEINNSKLEATHFSNINDQSSLSKSNKFKSEVAEENPINIEIITFLASIGLYVKSDLLGKETPKYNVIDFVDILKKFWLANPEASKEALYLQKEMVGNEKLLGCVHLGLWELCRYNFNLYKYINKIKKNGGMSFIRGMFNRNNVSTQGGGHNYRDTADVMAKCCSKRTFEKYRDIDKLAPNFKR